MKSEVTIYLNGTGFYDICGQEIKLGDYVLKSARSGRRSLFKFAKILDTVETKGGLEPRLVTQEFEPTYNGYKKNTSKAWGFCGRSGYSGPAR